MPKRHSLAFDGSLKHLNITVSVYTHAGLTMGYGHIMRCLAVAEALRDLGVVVRFLMDSSSDRARVEAAGYIVIVLKDSALATEYIVANLNPQEGPLLLDSYDISSKELEKLYSAGFCIAIFDDGMRLDNYPCDLVIDSAPRATELSYLGLPQTRFCLGSEYFPLRKEFMSARCERLIVDQVKIIIVTFGGSDNEDITYRVLSKIIAIEGQFKIVAILGPAYDGRAELFAIAEERVQVVRDVSDMGTLMATADLAICGGGCTALELAYMGVPMFVQSLSPNQVPVARSLAGAAQYLNEDNVVTDAEFVIALQNLIFDKPKREAMSRAGRSLIDGRGSERLARAILSIATNNRVGYK